jgi:hypothetical protein
MNTIVRFKCPTLFHRWKAEIYSYPRFITVESAHYTHGIHHYAQLSITMQNCVQVTQV